MATDRKIRWNEFLMDTDGEFSFKRLVPAICIVLFCIYFFVNLFTQRVLDPNALELILYVTVTCVGAQTVELFAKFRKTTIVSKDATVIQEANPLAGKTAVNEAVEKIVSTSTPPPTLNDNQQPTESKEENPQLLE